MMLIHSQFHPAAPQDLYLLTRSKCWLKLRQYCLLVILNCPIDYNSLLAMTILATTVPKYFYSTIAERHPPRNS